MLRNLSKSRSGLIAKKRGDSFQNFFEIRCAQQGVTCIRIPDGCRQISAHKTQRVRTPFDYVIGHGNKIIFLDLKSTANKTFTKSMCVDHQIYSLTKLSMHQDAGYLVYYSESALLVYYKVSQLRELEKRESLAMTDGLVLGKIFEAKLGDMFL